MTYDFANYKKDSLTRPRDIAWASPWMTFEKVGDKIQGIIKDVFYRPEEKAIVNGILQKKFAEQRAFTLEKSDKTLINVGIKRLPWMLPHTDNLAVGDPLTIVLESEKPSTTKGYSATKIYAFYGKHLPENVGKTVKELEAEDMAIGGSVEPSAHLEEETEPISTEFQDADPLK